MSGQLFTQYFLTDGIVTTAEWSSSVTDPAEFDKFRDGIRMRYEALNRSADPNEAVTEQDLIRPVLELLGWMNILPQQGTSRNEEIPDHLLFLDANSKKLAAEEPDANRRFLHATVVEESKRFGLSLDTRGQGGKEKYSLPHRQILRYMATANDIDPDADIRWGILTNGKVWRLYDQKARHRDTGYFEADLEQLLKAGNENKLRVFHLLFHRDAFSYREGAKTNFIEDAIEEGRRYERKVAEDLSGVVFESVFPRLVKALAVESKRTLEESREAALILLYRLLFVFYAEDRGLLPVNDTRYDDYGLREGVRDNIHKRTKVKDTYSDTATNYYDRLITLFKMIDKGDPSIGLPPYNGGLFGSEAAPLLERVRLSDAKLVNIIYDLSHTQDKKKQRHFVNYRDMSVQQLGSIYERLLERQPVLGEGGNIVNRPNPYARKDSGSFYTPQDLVDLIVDRTLGPLVEERKKTFEDKAAALENDPRPKDVRRTELESVDPAEAVLELKVLDPAMGSGHFLVTAVDYLSERIADLLEPVIHVPKWLNGDYKSPLVDRVNTIRDQIIQRGEESKWSFNEELLNEQAIIRRMVLKRCIYGVDKNPLTVELAKVSLWLHTFTVGSPLSFLDHHLRCGDSLLGMRVLDGRADLVRLGGGLFSRTAIKGIKRATDLMLCVEQISDADVAEVRKSATMFETIEDSTANLRGLLDFLCAHRWLTGAMKRKERSAFEAPVVMALGVYQKNGYKLLARGPDFVVGGLPKPNDADWAKFRFRWHKAQEIAKRERFLHWELAFPGIWPDWQNSRTAGGFDAIIGNPPWDRIEQQEVEWFAHRDDAIAHAKTAAGRKTLINKKRQTGDRLVRDYEKMRDRAAAFRSYARTSDSYRLLTGGRINIYSLFVERAMRLVKPDGIVGLLTPSGIYADRNASRFFKSVSTSGRVGSLFDFENRKIFFKDIHASFKFCALIFGGSERTFDQTECAFFLHDTATIQNSDRCFPMSPSDFARVNPNTGTAAVFRHRRDAEITRSIYERHPVLVDRSAGEERRTWPVRFMQGLFNMTSDSHLFRTEAQLETAGFYRAPGNRLVRSEFSYLPLYQGRMIHQFDHRSNSVRFNAESVHNPYISDEVTELQHADPSFSPKAQYWVPTQCVEQALPRTCAYVLGFRDIARSTDARTVIATIIPQAGIGNTIPLLIEDLNPPANENYLNALQGEWTFSAVVQAVLVSNLNSICFDFVARQKAQGTHLNWYIVEQLPVIAPRDYDRRFGKKTARELVLDLVLRLTYTAHDMEPFARDLGYDGQPFVWDEEKRRHLRARLDALYFHLYGLSRDDAGYILDTFPIVRREDEKAFGRYRTRDMILAYMNALAAGDTETDVDV